MKSLGHIGIVDLLLQCKTGGKFEGVMTKENEINVSMQDNTGNTPLMRSIAGGHKTIIDMLVLNGAKLDLQDIEGNTALHLACYENQLEIAHALLLGKAKSDIKNKAGKLAVELASGAIREKIESAIKALQ